MNQLKNYGIVLLLIIACTELPAQSIPCFGEKRELRTSSTMPYTKVKVGTYEGYFLLDFGTTGSTIDTNNFINGKPKPSLSSTGKFDDFNFFGSWGTVFLNIQNHSQISGLTHFKQAGIIGTDFLSLNIFTLDYSKHQLYRSNPAEFCADTVLIRMGFKAASTAGYYSNDLKKLNNNCTPNIPTVPVKIGTVNAVAQIDPGFDDALYRHSVNINQAFFNALTEAGINLIPNPAANLLLSTCINNVSEPVTAYKLPKGVSFSVTGIKGNPVLVSSDVHIFLKQTPAAAKNCGGIGTWQIPAAQMAASFLYDCKKVIFDPFKSRVWFNTK